MSYLKLFKVKSEEAIHNEKIEYISKELSQRRGELTYYLPTEYKGRFLRNSFISGGCIYSLYNNQQPKDYDFFLKSDQLAMELREYFLGQAGYHGNGISGGTYQNMPLIITDNAISIGKYQIITQWIGRPEDVVAEFDFHHNQYYFIDGKVEGLHDLTKLSERELKYNEKRARDICGTIIRTSKFIQRGMTIKNKEMAKMLLKLSEIGFNERELKILNDTSSDKHFSS